MGTIHPANSAQMSLSFEQGLSLKHLSLRECVATGVYQRGLGKIAGLIDLAPSKLSEKLSGGNDRKRDIGLDDFEAYLAKTGDRSPIYYLIDKYLSDPSVRRDQALTHVTNLLEALPAALAAAGITQSKKRG